MTGMLNVVFEELDEPLYYVLDEISSVMRSETPSTNLFRLLFFSLVFTYMFINV